MLLAVGISHAAAQAEIVALQRESAGKDEEIRQKQEELMVTNFIVRYAPHGYISDGNH